jgi:hypothetical protein
MPLNDDDKVFEKVRHLNLLAVGSTLGTIASEINVMYDKRKELSNKKDIKEIKDFFEKLPELQQQHRDLTMHVNIATQIKKETTKHEFRKTIETEQSKNVTTFYSKFRYHFGIGRKSIDRVYRNMYYTSGSTSQSIEVVMFDEYYQKWTWTERI